MRPSKLLDIVSVFSLRKQKWSQHSPLPHPTSKNEAVVIEPHTLYNLDGTCHALLLHENNPVWKAVQIGIDVSQLRPGYDYRSCSLVGTEKGIVILGRTSL